MRQRVVRTVVLLALAITLGRSEGEAAGQVPPATGDDLQVRLVTNKRAYLLLEPIVLRASITNVRRGPVRLYTLDGYPMSIWSAARKEPIRRCLSWVDLTDATAPLYVLDPGQTVHWEKVICAGPPEGGDAVPHLVASASGSYRIRLAGPGGEHEIPLTLMAPQGVDAAAYRELLDEKLAAALSPDSAEKNFLASDTAAERRLEHYLKRHPHSGYAEYIRNGLGRQILRRVDPRHRIGQEVKELKQWPQKYKREFEKAAALLEKAGARTDFVFAPEALLALGRVWIEFPLQDLQRAEPLAATLLERFPEAEATTQLHLLIAWEYLHFRQDPHKGAEYLRRVHIPRGVLNESFVYQQVILHLLRGNRDDACAVVRDVVQRHPSSSVIRSLREHSGLHFTVRHNAVVECFSKGREGGGSGWNIFAAGAV